MHETPFRARGPIDDASALATLNDGELEIVGRMPWSSNATFLVEIVCGDTELQGIYKPHQGERPLWDFPSGLYEREAAAYELSAALGWDLVPPTVVRDGALGEGSVQLYVPCDYEEHYFTLLEHDEHHHSLMALCAFDFVANSTDRKAGHVLLGHDGELHAIDNGLSFHTEFKLRTVIWDWAGEPVPSDLLNNLLALCEEGLPRPLAALLATDEQDALLERANGLVRAGRFPVDPTGRRYPWPLV